MPDLGSLPALAVRPPVDPLESAAKLAGFQAQLQQNRMGNVQLQQAQQQLKDQQILGQLMIKHQGNLDKVAAEAPTAGVTPNSVLALNQHLLDVKTKTADLVSKQGAIAAQQADLMAGAHDAVDKAPAEMKPQVYQSQLSALQRQGIDTSQLPPQYPGDDQFKLIGAVVQGHKQQVDQALREREVSAQELRAQGTFDAAHKPLPGQIPLGPQRVDQLNQMMEKRWQVLHPGQPLFPTYKLSPDATTGDFERTDKMMEAAEKATTGQQNHQDSMGIRNAMLAIAQANATPAKGEGGQPSAIAQAIASGSMKWQDAVSNRTPMNVREALLKEVKGINPNFNSGDFQVEQNVRKAFTTGKPAEELVAFNTAISHADLLKKAADAMDNGDVRALNSAGNALGVQFGSDKATNFKVIAQAYTAEVNKALSSNHITDTELKQIGETIPSNASPAQIKGAVEAYKNLMASKKEQRRQQLESGLQGKSTLQTETSPAPSTSGAKEIHYKIVNGQLVPQ